MFPGTSPARYKVFFLQQIPGTAPIPVSIFANASRSGPAWGEADGRVREARMSVLLFCHISCAAGSLKPHPRADGHRGSCVANAQPLLQQGEKHGQGLGARPSEAPPLSYRYLFSFAALCFFLFVFSTSDSPAGCSRLIEKSSSALCCATRDAVIDRQQVRLI